MTPSTPTLLSASQWREAQQDHSARAHGLIQPWQEAHDAGRPHAVLDFLFQYYMVRPARLATWHPGMGVELSDATSWAAQQWYRVDDGRARVDAQAFVTARSRNVTLIRDILHAVSAAAPRYSCFGMHEWAMVYRQEEHRHPLPLRLGQEGTDHVVDSHSIACSHWDAYRFFTPAAKPLNTLTPTATGQCGMDQPGCLHANMDLYKYASRLGPLVPGELLLDCFELACEIRWLDMQASPYDMSAFRMPNVPVETPAGKEEYVRRQRAFTARAQVLRARLIEIADAAAGLLKTPLPAGGSGE